MNPLCSAICPCPSTKRSIVTIIVAVTLFLLGLACESLMNEFVHELWQATEVNRQGFLTQIADLLSEVSADGPQSTIK